MGLHVRMSMSDRLPFSCEGQLLFLGRLAKQHKGKKYRVIVLTKGGFGDKIVDEARALLTMLLADCAQRTYCILHRSSWDGNCKDSLPPLLTRRLTAAFKTFMFS